MNTTTNRPTAPESDDMVRGAYRYLQLLDGATVSGWVSLVDLRCHLQHLTREEQDDSLRRLFRSQEANLVPESNQKALREEDRDAALWVGGEHKHLVCMGR